MNNCDLLENVLQNLSEPIVIIDLNHTIIYMNKKGIEQYKDSGGLNLLGASAFDCHNSKSIRRIVQLTAILKSGEEEWLEGQSDSKKSFIRAVRDKYNNFIAYYERYEFVK